MTDKQFCWLRKAKYNSEYAFGINSKVLPEQLQIGENNILGVGKYSNVFGGFYNENLVAIKFIPLDTFIPCEDYGSLDDNKEKAYMFTKEDFEKEIFNTQHGIKIGISPNLFYFSIVDLTCYKAPKNIENPLHSPKKIGILVTENKGISLEEYISKNLEEFEDNQYIIKDKFIELVKKLFESGYKHVDLHFGNVLIDPENLSMSLIDLSLEKIEEFEESTKKIELWENYYKTKLMPDWDILASTDGVTFDLSTQ